MATDSSYLSEDQFLCSICLEVFADPVSIPCGHNFCKACINRHWKDKEHRQCPLCKEEFSKGIKLCVNTTFREVVENFKKHHVVPKNEMPAKPGDVLCDCCLHNNRKASKTCLVCLASYCEAHLESHQRVAALKRHNLTDPVQNLEAKICRKHNMILESLCSNDPTPVCFLCIKHDTLPLEEEYDDQNAQPENKNGEIQSIKLKKRKKTKRKNDKHEAFANSVQESDDSKDIYIWCDQHCHTYTYIPLNRGISEGRFYFEVQTKGRSSWDLGVVSESVRGKRIFEPRSMNGRWVIRLSNYTKCRAGTPNTATIPERVWVCVDYEQGIVFFCDADTADLFFILSECWFNEKVFLFFRRAPLQKCPHCIKQNTPEKPDDKLINIILYIVLFFALCSLFKQ